MTFKFFCKYFNPRVAAWLTAVWFALLLVAIFVFSAYREEAFMYLNF